MAALLSTCAVMQAVNAAISIDKKIKRFILRYIQELVLLFLIGDIDPNIGSQVNRATGQAVVTIAVIPGLVGT